MGGNRNILLRLVTHLVVIYLFGLKSINLSSVNKDGAATQIQITFPEVCPLGEPLRSDKGETTKCNCPPHPFCPLLYYCKIVEHGEAGICCPDFRIETRHKIKPEDSRLPTDNTAINATMKCPHNGTCFDVKVAKNETKPELDVNKHRLPRISKDHAVASPAVPNMPAPKHSKIEKPKEDTGTTTPKPTIPAHCKPIESKDLPDLPAPQCTYMEVDPRPDGCPLPPKVVCPPEPRKFRDCPPFVIPIVPPDCTLGEQKFDSDGCLMAPELICKKETVTARTMVVPRAPASRPKAGNRKIHGQKKHVTLKPKLKFMVTPRPIVRPTLSPSPPPCPTYSLPPTLSPDCSVAMPKKDNMGCYLPPEIVCEKQPTTLIGFFEERLPEMAGETITANPDVAESRRNCPKVRTPAVQPGCKLLDAKYDDKGCMLMPEITCDPSIIARNCLPLILPKMNPMCTFGPNRNDTNGCPMVPEIICPIPDFDDIFTTALPETVSLYPKNEPKIMSHCPYIPPPYLPAGCTYGIARYDERGCFLEPEVICPQNNAGNGINDNIVPPVTDLIEIVTMSPRNSEFGPSPYKASKKEFKDMLTAEFFLLMETSVPPDAGMFRRTTAIAITTSGRFSSCQTHSDCFHLREPKEWCDTGSPQSQAVWTEKSCHCSDDTIVPACVVERSYRGHLQWTFCADYSQCIDTDWYNKKA